MAAWIAGGDLKPDLIVSSTATRAAVTAEAVAAACDLEVAYSRALYHASPREALAALLDHATDSCRRVMWVGHNPGLESAVEGLTGEFARMPTAALARIDLDVDSWSDVRFPTQGELAGVWRPRELWTSE